MRAEKDIEYKTVTVIKADDWAGYIEEVPIHRVSDIAPLEGWVVGLLIDETENFITLSHHWFPENEKFRFITCVNKMCVKERIDFRIGE